MGMDKPIMEYDQTSASNSANINVEELPSESRNYRTSFLENSTTSYQENEILEFGPIKVKPRKKPALTLASGRRSKYDVLSPEEEQKREIRRARNRAAADRVRVNRLQIEQQLRDNIAALENEEQNLLTNVDMLRRQRLHLETRLATREQISTMTEYDPLNAFMPSYTSNGIPTTTILQQVEQPYEYNLEDLFSDALTSGQNHQESYSDVSRSIALSEDLDDFFLNT